jgi:hypothetical protein
MTRIDPRLTGYMALASRNALRTSSIPVESLKPLGWAARKTQGDVFISLGSEASATSNSRPFPPEREKDDKPPGSSVPRSSSDVVVWCFCGRWKLAGSATVSDAQLTWLDLVNALVIAMIATRSAIFGTISQLSLRCRVLLAS